MWSRFALGDCSGSQQQAAQGRQATPAIDAIASRTAAPQDPQQRLASGLRDATHLKLARVRALLAKAESTEFDEEADALTAKAQEVITCCGRRVDGRLASARG